ncbi:hypothetical protein GCM10014715_62800 [Streptomyces spiralis]|uniref:Uncharacterized protein n=1 Tax=Streptomyces spiralis TaxID=66376 RepID=A0A919ACS5_9ACTN|nr:hypothetical protein GCM10014715_62800 [Streptomyces spiralis]
MTPLSDTAPQADRASPAARRRSPGQPVARTDGQRRSTHAALITAEQGKVRADALAEVARGLEIVDRVVPDAGSPPRGRRCSQGRAFARALIEHGASVAAAQPRTPHLVGRASHHA